mmetsp:Transcript_36602/g.97612  ORF Transcript_36602/g.97612 Transcript_36602/m.97612 type:complete len:80 (+) Transcript_36602:229-468(+)
MCVLKTTKKTTCSNTPPWLGTSNNDVDTYWIVPSVLPRRTQDQCVARRRLEDQGLPRFKPKTQGFLMLLHGISCRGWQP